MPERDQDLVAMIAKFRANVEDLLADNDKFHEALKGPSPIQFRGITSDYSIEPHEALLWKDPIAYMVEYAAWDGLAEEERHQRAVDYLKSSNQLAIFRDLVESIRRGRIAPFVGAGSSFCLGLPLWCDALAKLAQEIEDATPAKKPACDAARTEIAAGNLMKAGAILYSADKTAVDQFVLTNYATKPDLTLADVSGLALLLPDLSDGCIVTTNYDNLIEKVFVFKGKPIEGYMHGTQEHNFAVNLIKGDLCILKLHGDAKNSTTYILSDQQYKRAYGAPFDYSKPLAKALRQIYVSHTLLFLGCGLDQDKTLELFTDVKLSKAFDVPQHFAIVERSTTTQLTAQKQKRLGLLNIRTLWFDRGDFSMIESLLQLALAAANKRIRV
jgi:hypothetical protein